MRHILPGGEIDTHDSGHRSQTTLPVRDARQKFVQRAVLWLLALPAAASSMAALLHGQDPQSRATDRAALAERDVLLGLYNRRAGERYLGALLAQADKVTSLILFDIDHFKQVNDRHGHAADDAVLIEVGHRCAQQLGRDDLFARWAGEEFLIVLPGVPPAQGVALAERLRMAIQAVPIEPAGVVTASFGVTAVRVEDTVAHVLQRADDALYQAKADGRDRVRAL